MPDPAQVVIVDPKGTKHVFPAGFDPVKAAAIVRESLGKSESTSPDSVRMKSLAEVTGEVLAGMGKGLGRTVVDLGRAAGHLTGLSDIPEDAETQLGLDPTTVPERVGRMAEGIGEFMVPSTLADKAAVTLGTKLAAKAPKVFQGMAKFFPKVAAQGAVGAADATAKGQDPLTSGALAAATPVVGGVVGVTAPALTRAGTALARSAIKPTVSTLKKIAGTGRNLDAAAEGVAQFIVKNRLMTPEQARSMFNAAENELQIALKGKAAPTDAAARAARYLGALERSAAKQGLGAEDVAQIRNAAAELVEGPMGEDIVTMVTQPHPTLVDAAGHPIPVLVPKVTRRLRSDVPAEEALESARASGRWSTRKQWGEQKGSSMEAQKAVERAQRDAVKVTVPEAKALLRTESQAITAEEVLARMKQRQGNREGVGLAEKAMAAVEISQGKLPIMAAASNWLRGNGLKAGIWADRMAEAIRRNDAKTAAEILTRFGVALEMQPQ